MQVYVHETGSKVNFGTAFRDKILREKRAIKTVFNMYSVYSNNVVTSKVTVAKIQSLETTSLPFPISGFSKNTLLYRL